MPDYSACLNRNCDRRLDCARYRMRHSERQTVAEFPAEGCTAYLSLAVDHPWPTYPGEDRGSVARWVLVTEEVADERGRP